MKKRRKIDWNARIDWFDDWREWFGPKTYGTGYTARSWKGAVAVGVVIAVVTFLTMTLQYYLS